MPDGVAPSSASHYFDSWMASARRQYSFADRDRATTGEGDVERVAREIARVCDFAGDDKHGEYFAFYSARASAVALAAIKAMPSLSAAEARGEARMRERAAEDAGQEALEQLVAACEQEFTSDDTETDGGGDGPWREPDDEAVFHGADGPGAITFGHIRRARAALPLSPAVTVGPDEVERLREAVRTAERVFRRYEEMHRAKGTDDGLAKAAANRDMADTMLAALSASGEGEA